MMAHVISASSLAILVFYKDQQHLLVSLSASPGIALHTVDSIQGREYDIIILLWTHTDITTDTGAFVDDPFRLNIALIRVWSPVLAVPTSELESAHGLGISLGIDRQPGHRSEYVF
ncbi:unnamed protein product [Nippostrongylus brasiliensis]|uniref:AAA_12 domain-containing protein n=1 Tax=Nippostrongylus brasiliensis TaxID=27835 RepID=A0A0N4YTC6_NIPBR|nr:unnamed protein product [Nippostrongylus brasiliensis]